MYYAGESSLVNVDIIDDSMSCLPDLLRKVLQPFLLLVVGLLALVPIIRPNSTFSLRRATFSTTSPLLYWGLAAGVISLPPDGYNKKEPYNEAASA